MSQPPPFIDPKELHRLIDLNIEALTHLRDAAYHASTGYVPPFAVMVGQKALERTINDTIWCITTLIQQMSSYPEHYLSHDTLHRIKSSA